MASHESWSRSALTTKSTKSSPLINLQTRTKPHRNKMIAKAVRNEDVNFAELNVIGQEEFFCSRRKLTHSWSR
jgi:hypothetical protein